MRLVNGKTLHDLIKAGQLSPERAVAIITQVAPYQAPAPAPALTAPSGPQRARKPATPELHRTP